MWYTETGEHELNTLYMLGNIHIIPLTDEWNEFFDAVTDSYEYITMAKEWLTEQNIPLLSVQNCSRRKRDFRLNTVEIWNFDYRNV